MAEIERILLIMLVLLYVWALWKLHRVRLRKWWRGLKGKSRRKWKPKTPEDCERCEHGFSLELVNPKREVMAYRERKSKRGRKKGISTRGYGCPNRVCEYYGIMDEQIHALVGDGKRGKGKAIQYLKCQWCGKRFTSRIHTPLYWLRMPEGRVVMVLMLLAEGCDISVMVRCTGHMEATVTRWLERAGDHSIKLHNRMFRELVLVFVQLDELYARVRWVGKKWLWLAIDPVSKILPSLHLGDRKNVDAFALLHDLKLRLASGCVPAFTSDGLRGYFYAITAHFGEWYLPEGVRKPHWKVSLKLFYGQMVKRRQNRKTVFTLTRMLWGKYSEFKVLLEEHGFSGLIQTAFIERVNGSTGLTTGLTIRRGVAPLMRKTWSLAQNSEHLILHVEWWRSYYHFVREHESLKVPLPGLVGRYRKRTPAMAAGLTNRIWTVADILKMPMFPA